MSRIGKRPVHIPKEVTVTREGNVLTMKGPKGTLTRGFPEAVQIEITDGALVVTPKDQSRQARSLHGLVRTLIHNMVVGVHQGFTKELQIFGTGYRADMKGNAVVLSLGYSHPVEFPLPEGVKGSVEKQVTIKLESADRELLGLTAAKLKAIRPVEPYKGKGIRYSDEVVRRKVGKAGSK